MESNQNYNKKYIKYKLKYKKLKELIGGDVKVNELLYTSHHTFYTKFLAMLKQMKELKDAKSAFTGRFFSPPLTDLKKNIIMYSTIDIKLYQYNLTFEKQKMRLCAEKLQLSKDDEILKHIKIIFDICNKFPKSILKLNELFNKSYDMVHYLRAHLNRDFFNNIFNNSELVNHKNNLDRLIIVIPRLEKLNEEFKDILNNPEFEAETNELSVYLDHIQDPVTKYATYMKTYIFSDIQFENYENQFLNMLKQIQERKYSNKDLSTIWDMAKYRSAMINEAQDRMYSMHGGAYRSSHLDANDAQDMARSGERREKVEDIKCNLDEYLKLDLPRQFRHPTPKSEIIGCEIILYDNKLYDNNRTQLFIKKDLIYYENNNDKEWYICYSKGSDTKEISLGQASKITIQTIVDGFKTLLSNNIKHNLILNLPKITFVE